MIQSQILNTLVSAHHGVISKENELQATLELLKTNPEIGMVEIDFIYENGEFISCHDYRSIKNGSELSIWFDKLVILKKILWIDIKDSAWSILSKNFSRFDVKAFFNFIRLEKKRFSKMNTILENYLLISCQYDHLIDEISENNCDEFLLAYDIPFIGAYVAKTISPSCTNMMVNYYVQEYSEIFLKTKKCNIICLDSSFFSCKNEIVSLLSKLNNISIIILYSFKTTDQIDITIPGKHIIIQYDY